jgi:hypothetical protein
MKITRKNVLLVQFHDSSENHDGVKHFDISDSEQVSIAKGFKVYSIHDGYSKLVTIYNHENDSIDLSCLLDKIDIAVLVAVSKDNYGKFRWVRFELANSFDTDKSFAIKELRDCNTKESQILDKFFPEFLANAF